MENFVDCAKCFLRLIPNYFSELSVGLLYQQSQVELRLQGFIDSKSHRQNSGH